MAKTPDVGRSSEGFLKVGSPADITAKDRVALVRKGNEFFNQQRYDAAKRVFLTVKYADGLIRLGDHYMAEGQTLEAFRMFWIAGDRRRIEEMAEKMAMVVRKWLHDDRETE